jgi:dihydropyrimidinase
VSVDLVVSGGTLVGPDGTRPGAIAVDGETIVSVGRNPEALPDAETVVDASGLLVLPGVVDPHVHLDDHVSEDSYRTGTRAAALGGVTTCLDFAWGPRENADTPATLLEGIETKRAKADEAVVDVGVHGGILREDPAVFEVLPAAVEAGVTSFKIYTAYEFGLSNGFLDRLFGEVADLGAVVLGHTEDRSVCESLEGRLREQGRTDPTDYPRSRPPYAEAMAAENVARLAVEHGVDYYGVHTSCRAAAEALARYTGHDTVRAETCAHYLTLDAGVYERQGSLPRIAPPIRSAADVDALFEHVDRGTIDVVSTDHVAQKRARKESSDWWEGPFGANSLQHSLSVVHDVAVNERGLSYPTLVRLMCTNPARTFGLDRKGTLEPGTDADLVLFDPDESYTVSAADNASTADYSVYEGRTVTGRVVRTYVRGTVVADEGQVTAGSHGEFVRRSLPEW